VPFTCRCGHSAGTRAAFEAHLRRAGGGPAHAASSPPATPRASRRAVVGPPASGKRKRSPEQDGREASPEASLLKRLPFMEEEEDALPPRKLLRSSRKAQR